MSSTFFMKYKYVEAILFTANEISKHILTEHVVITIIIIIIIIIIVIIIIIIISLFIIGKKVYLQ